MVGTWLFLRIVVSMSSQKPRHHSGYAVGVCRCGEGRAPARAHAQYARTGNPDDEPERQDLCPGDMCGRDGEI